jgi:hypothetical protein
MPGAPIRQMTAEAVAQLQHSGKFVEEKDAAIVRQKPVIKGDLNVSWRPVHSEPHFTKSDVKLRTLKLSRRPVNQGQKHCRLCVLTPDPGMTVVVLRSPPQKQSPPVDRVANSPHPLQVQCAARRADGMLRLQLA